MIGSLLPILDYAYLPQIMYFILPWKDTLSIANPSPDRIIIRNLALKFVSKRTAKKPLVVASVRTTTGSELKTVHTTLSGNFFCTFF